MKSSTREASAAPEHPGHSDVLLRVRRSDDRRLHYTLSSPSGRYRFLPSRTVSSPLQDPDKFRRLLLRRLEDLRLGLDAREKALRRDEARRDAESLGHLLAERIFPPVLRDVWRELDPGASLLVWTNEPWIPWEMVKPPGTDFFAAAFRLSRWLDGGGDVLPPAQSLHVETQLVIEAARATSDPLEQGLLEIDRLRRLGERAGVEHRTIDEARRTEVESALRESSFQLLHTVAHGEVPEAADEARLALHGPDLLARHLTGDELVDNLRQERPLVVFASCDLGRLGLSLTGLAGWPERWIGACGASAFLAPLWPVNDRFSALFLRSFYEQIFDARPLGEAVFHSRRELRRQYPHGLDWLAWSLYGDPCARIGYGRAPVPHPVPVERETTALRVAPGPVALDKRISLPERSWDPELSPPGALLRADHAVVPFHLRDQELEELEGWCRDGPRLGFRLYHGGGGMGKSRLALELCKVLRVRGWLAGEVASETDGAELAEALVEHGGSAFLVVDYAESRGELLEDLLAGLRQGETATVRVILLARSVGDWWDQLQSAGEGVGEMLASRATEVRLLSPLALSVEDRSISYRLAADAFAEALGRPLPEDEPEDLTSEAFERALLLHISALGEIEGVAVKDEDGILDFVLRRERRFWHRQAERRDLDPALHRAIGRGMALITLLGGVEGEAEAVDALRRLRSLSDERESRLADVARLLADVYPGRRWIEPLQPDLLGEQLVERELERGGEEILDAVFGPT